MVNILGSYECMTTMSGCMRGSSIEGSGGGVPGILNIQIVKFPKIGLGSPREGEGGADVCKTCYYNIYMYMQ